MENENNEVANLVRAGVTAAAMSVAAILFGNAAIARAETFDGPYVGAAAGYEDYSGDLSGAAYHAYAGWNFRLGDGWVLAPEVRFGDSSAENTVQRSTATQTTDARLAIDNQLGASLRLGRLLSDNVLVYAAGGWERFEVNATTTRRAIPCDGCTPVVQDFSFDEDLWTLGGGVEVALSQRIALRGAYTYADGVSYHRHSLTAGLTLQF